MSLSVALSAKAVSSLQITSILANVGRTLKNQTTSTLYRLPYIFSNSNASKNIKSTCQFKSKSEDTSQNGVCSLNTFECVYQGVG